MKHFIPIVCLLILGATLQAQNLTFHPEKPSLGEQIMIKYDPAGTPLEEAEELQATAYLLEGQAPKALEVALKQEGGGYIGAVTSTAETKALFVYVAEKEGERYDNNGGQGYYQLVYTRDKTAAPVPEAYAVLAQAYGSWYRFMHIEENNEQAIAFMKQAFASNPDAKAKDMYINLYATLSRSTGNEEIKNEVLALADELAGKRRASEEEWNRAYYLYLNLREEEKAEELGVSIRKKYKEGVLVREKMVRDFYNNAQLEDRLALYEQFIKTYGDDEENKGTISSMASMIAGGYGKKGDWDQFWSYMEKVDNPTSKAGTYNNLAWNMTGGSLDGEAEDLEMAEKLSAAALKLIKEELETAANKPDFYTAEEWKEGMQSTYAMYADTYALIAYHRGHYKDALHYQEIAGEQNGFQNGEMNERYAVYYEKVKSPKETIALLEGLIRQGTATSRMKDQHRRLFMDTYTLAEAYDQYLAELGKEAAAKMKEEMKKKMIDEAAPAFTLIDLEGREVSLESLKGKVVVLDYWATWCGPCKASFPGMQKAVDKYAVNPDVVFLFINSWESGKDKKKSAGDFIRANSYSFRVLMDENDEVIAKYKVEGIPTKFVIDRSGRIRFKSIGFGGSDDGLVQELSLMIEMAGSEPAAGAE